MSCFYGKARPFNKVGCTREYKTKLRICFNIPLICATLAAVEYPFRTREGGFWYSGPLNEDNDRNNGSEVTWQLMRYSHAVNS